MKEQNFLIKKIERDFYTLGLRNDNIVHVFLKNEAIVDRKLQDDFIASLHELKGGQSLKIPAVVELGEFITVLDNDSLDKLQEFSETLLCIVICAENAGHRMLAKFYNSKFKPLNDFVIVTDFYEAIAYAKNRMREQNIDDRQ